MTKVSKNMYISELDDAVDKYINTYHRQIKMKPVDVKSNTSIEYSVKNNDKNHTFTGGDHVRM